MMNQTPFPDELEDTVQTAQISLRPKDDELVETTDGFTLNVDNMAAIKVAKDPENSRVMKHVRVREHFVREHVRAHRITLKWVRTTDQVAKIFTKALSGNIFHRLRKKCGFRKIQN